MAHRNALTRAARALDDKLEALKSKLFDATHQAKSHGGAALKRFSGAVRKHPIPAVLIAFAIGSFGMRIARR